MTLLAAIWLTFLSSAHAAPVRTILLFGDSIIAGYGLKGKESPPERLQQILRKTFPDIVVINGGVSGDTTSSGRARLEWTLDQSKPDLMLLALGGNDVLRGINAGVVQRNLDVMIYDILKRSIPLILSRVETPENYGPEFKKSYDQIYVYLKQRYKNVPIYPFLLTRIYGKTDYMLPDGIHPNARGAEIIAQDLAHYLLPYLKQRAGGKPLK